MKKLNSKSPTLTMEEAFENFLFAKSAQGVTEKTIKSYILLNLFFPVIKIPSGHMALTGTISWTFLGTANFSLSCLRTLVSVFII